VGYYTRVLTKRPDCPSLESLKQRLAKDWPTMVLSLEGGDPGHWTALLLAHSDGLAIAAIDRNPVAAGTLGSDELSEFIVAVASGRPETAVPWLTTFLRSVRTIYAFQHLFGTQRARGDEALRCISETIWAGGQAILRRTGRDSQMRMGTTSCGSSRRAYPVPGGWRS
jgi:hypothetical protein